MQIRPTPNELRALFSHVTSDAGNMGCALYLLEQWSGEAVVVRPHMITSVVQQV